MNVKDFDFFLPQELIAQHPSKKRDESRLLAVNMDTGELLHRHFYDIAEYLREGDCLVLNDSKVIPARLFAEKKETGAHVEIFLLKRKTGDIWECMVRPGKRLKAGDELIFGGAHDFEATVVEHSPDGGRLIEFRYSGLFMERLEELGQTPLPPYILRKNGNEEEDRERYQTVYAREDGSVAAPTAGLHFTKELLEKIEKKGVKLAFVTLHVGIGTFRPVKAERVEEHKMHFEEYTVDEKSAETVNECKKSGGRIIAVGTTAARTLESAAYREGSEWLLRAGSGATDIFIYPGYGFKLTDCLITNFHLPKSTLIMLVSALYDREKVLSAYEEAIREKYRFFSYGDACFFMRERTKHGTDENESEVRA